MKWACNTAAFLVVLSIATASSAAPLSQESIWYGSDASTSAVLADDDTLKANAGMIQDCLIENKSDKAACIGVTKSYCRIEQPTCNLQEAAAWNYLASKKHPASKKLQTAWLHQAEKACAYSSKEEGYAGINPPDPWLDKLAPSGCVLQRSAHRYLHLRKTSHHDE